MMNRQTEFCVNFLLILLFCNLIYCDNQEKRLCADPKCQTAISKGKTIQNYSPNFPGLLQFGINKNVQILSKEQGHWKDYWYIEITGRKGYVKKTFIKEEKIVVNTADLIEVDSDVQELIVFMKPPANIASSLPEVLTQTTEGVTAPLPNANSNPVVGIINDKASLGSTEESTKISPTHKLDDDKDNKDLVTEDKDEGVEVESEEYDDEDTEEEYGELSNEISEEDISNNNSEVQASIETNLASDKVKNEPIPDFKSLHTQNTFLNTDYSTYAPSLSQENASNADILSANIANEIKTEVILENHKDKDFSIDTTSTGLPLASDASNNVNDATVQNGAEFEIDRTSDVAIPEIIVASDNISVESVDELKTKTPVEELKDTTTNGFSLERQTSNIANEATVQNNAIDTTLNAAIANTIPPNNNVVVEPAPPVQASTIISSSENPGIDTLQTEPSTIVQTDEHTVKEDNPNDDVTANILNYNPLTDNNTIDTTTTANTVISDSSSIPSSENVSASLSEDSLNDNLLYNLQSKANEQQEPQLNEVPDTMNSNLENVNIESNNIDEPRVESLSNDNNVNNSTIALKFNSTSTGDNSFNEYTNEVSNDSTYGSYSEANRLANTNPTSNKNHYPTVEIKATTPDPGQDNVYYNSTDDVYSVPTTPVPLHSQQTHEYPSLNENLSEEPVVKGENGIEPNPHTNVADQDLSQGFISNTETAQQDQITQNTQDQVTEPEITYNPFYEVDTQEETPSYLYSVLETMSNFWNKLQNDQEGSVVNNFHESTETAYNPVQESPDQAQVVDGYCEHLTPNECPKSRLSPNTLDHLDDVGKYSNEPSTNQCLNDNEFFAIITNKTIEMFDIIICLSIVAVAVLTFLLGHYCISHSRKENTLISKLNIVERSLLASNKEANMVKHDLIQTRNKLVSIEDNSFGSNDMVVALKKELEASALSKIETEEKITVLEKELENAAEAGLELNKIVSELLNNQSGDDSIISSVEELQKQLNEQQNTILQINTTLAEKSRENSELQMLIAEQEAKLVEEVRSLRELNENHQKEEDKLKTELEESKSVLDTKISDITIRKGSEIEVLSKKLAALTDNYNDVYKKWQVSDSRVEALEECLSNMKKDPKVNIKDFMDVANLKADVLAVKRERDSFKERLEGEMDARKLLEDHVQIVSEEVSSLKHEYTQSEKEKVEAQTRLDVLSTYFKEKETQLQKELSVKEAMWLKQQGETTSTVERVRLMQDEIQALKSQNDSFRAEIEAQSAAHKAQITNLENRAHDTWIAARQSERKLEESRSEATALRRKLTSIVNSSTNDTSLQNRITNSVDGLQPDFNGAPSPIHMDSPGSPLLGGLPPPPPPFIPPPFMSHPFMGMPPPFMSPGEMRPPPLGRLMSPPPPPPDRYSPSIIDERDRYSPENGRYSPDSRYNYNTDIMSTYDTETDLSPPPSPHLRSGGGGGGGSNVYNSREREHRSRGYKAYSPPPKSDRSKKSKGVPSSGSAESFDSRKGKAKGKGKV